jgi:hypothetical protein
MEDAGARAAIRELEARNLGLQFLFVYLCQQVASLGPEAKAHILLAFDKAADQIEHFCVGVGKDVTYAPSALKLIEDLRAALTAGDEQKRHTV